MITFLEGTVVDKQPTRLVLNVGGVGYEVFIPLSSYDRLPARDAACRILTVDYVREDSHQLFGFMTEPERQAFALLTGITGIGPKLALSALSGLSVRELKAAAVEGDVKRLSSISGVGKKMAERMVVELRHKLKDSEALEAIAGAEEDVDDHRLTDAMLALGALGYKQEQAQKMVLKVAKSGLDVKASVEDIIRDALAR